MLIHYYSLLVFGIVGAQTTSSSVSPIQTSVSQSIITAPPTQTYDGRCTGPTYSCPTTLLCQIPRGCHASTCVGDCVTRRTL